jgi:hypothetical protein
VQVLESLAGGDRDSALLLLDVRHTEKWPLRAAQIVAAAALPAARLSSIR